MSVSYVSCDDCEENSFLRLNHHRNLASSATTTSPRDNVLTRSGKAGVRERTGACVAHPKGVRPSHPQPEVLTAGWVDPSETLGRGDSRRRARLRKLCPNQVSSPGKRKHTLGWEASRAVSGPGEAGRDLGARACYPQVHDRTQPRGTWVRGLSPILQIRRGRHRDSR